MRAHSMWQVIDIVFLHGCSKPTICVLYQDPTEDRHVKTYEVALVDQDFDEGPWSQHNVDSGANMLIALPGPVGGVLIVGTHTIVYHGGRPDTIKVCFTAVTGVWNTGTLEHWNTGTLEHTHVGLVHF